MSEYWKSVPRKFCDFCKCWITDNKPSVDFHERGKRHQENVELRLKEVRKKSLQKSMDDEQLQKDMEKMEKAALEAFKKDLKNNPELAAQYGVSLEAKPQSSNSTDKTPPVKLKQPKKEKTDKKAEEKVKEWWEAVTPEGYHYYWSTATGESCWEAPEDYLSIAEQEALNPPQAAPEATSVPDCVKTEEAKVEESPAIDNVTTIPEPKIVPRITTGNSRSAYGSWSVVKEVEQPKMYDDTSLPPALDEIPLPSESSSEDSTNIPRRPKFKEKTVTTLCPESGETVAFKKRKIASGARNARQKTDDE